MAYLVARLFWQYAQIKSEELRNIIADYGATSHGKMEGIQKIIDHYGDSLPGKMMNGKVISLEEYKLAMSLE